MHQTTQSADLRDNFLRAFSTLERRKNKRFTRSHLLCIVLHDLKGYVHMRGQIRFIDYQHIGVCYARTAFTRNFLSLGDIDNIDRYIGKVR